VLLGLVDPAESSVEACAAVPRYDVVSHPPSNGSCSYSDLDVVVLGGFY
jgi:hypothetical protein